MEQASFGVKADLSKRQWKAAIQTIVGMWENEYYEEHSEFLDFPRRMVTPKPFQDPHPPCWMAAVSDSSAVTAGENALGLLAMSILNPIEKLNTLVQNYRAASATARPLTKVVNKRVASYTLVHCVENRRDLERNNVWPAIQWWYTSLAEFFLKWELAEMPEHERKAAFPHLENILAGKFDIRQFDREDMIIVGTPDECLRKLRRYQDMGIDQTLCYVQFGPVPHDAVMRSLELLGREVIPALNASAQGGASQGRKQAIQA
jgi:alkanesulfonate monooxygenase SsuD/methylene tetrahydromethanopterin reductase-like flavin-dependent oxidoreductase (luciferase family)